MAPSLLVQRHLKTLAVAPLQLTEVEAPPPGPEVHGYQRETVLSQQQTEDHPLSRPRPELCPHHCQIPLRFLTSPGS